MDLFYISFIILIEHGYNKVEIIGPHSYICMDLCLRYLAALDMLKISSV